MLFRARFNLGHLMMIRKSADGERNLITYTLIPEKKIDGRNKDKVGLVL